VERDAALTQKDLVISGLRSNLTDLQTALAGKEVEIVSLQVDIDDAFFPATPVAGAGAVAVPG